MPIISPQIQQGKKNREDFISYLTSLLPEGNIPNPPTFGQNVPFVPSTYQETGRNVLDMLVPQPEDSLIGLMKPNISWKEVFANPVRDYPKYKSVGISLTKDGKWLSDATFTIDPDGIAKIGMVSGKEIPLEDWLRITRELKSEYGINKFHGDRIGDKLNR